MLQVEGCYGLENLSKFGGNLIQQQMKSLIDYSKKDGASSSSGNESLLEKKSQTAANKHALAERLRRRRINNHLNTLREFFPYLPKSDKPRVLMETVRYLKELRKKMADYHHHDVEMGNDGEECCSGSKGNSSLFLPTEKDEVNVSYCEGGGDDDQERFITVKAMICCEDRPSLMRDLTDAVKSAKGKVVKVEMGTIGGRTKAALVVQWCKDGGGGGGGGEEEVGSLVKALTAVLDNRAFGCPTLLGPSWTTLGLQRAGS